MSLCHNNGHKIDMFITLLEIQKPLLSSAADFRDDDPLTANRKMVMNLFLNQQTTAETPVSFTSMGVMSDFWGVHMGPVLDGLYWESWYNGHNVRLAKPS